MNFNDNNNEGITKILKSLQQVKVPHNFESDLMRKINSAEFKETKNTESFWEKIFVPAKFIPSAALAIAAVVILFMMDLNSDNNDNPLMVQPKVRQDVLVSDPFSTDMQIKNEIQKKKTENDKLVKNEKTKPQKQSKEYFAKPSSNVSSIYAIDKKGLNFRQINLNINERRQIDKLKQKMINFIKNSNK